MFDRADYDRTGHTQPIPVFSTNEIEAIREKALHWDQRLDLMHSDYRCKANVLFHWIDDITRHDTIIRCVRELLGPDFSCWDTLLWFKQPRDEKFVSFHQDATYWNLSPKNGVTVWLALTDATPENGAVIYHDGSQHFGQMVHLDQHDANNLLMRGQSVDRARLPEPTPCPAGSVLMHHPLVIHGSRPNQTDEARLALGMVFIRTDCQPVATYAPETTVMVSGEDRFNYMLHDPAPDEDFSEAAQAAWKLAYDRQHTNYYKMKQDAEYSTR